MKNLLIGGLLAASLCSFAANAKTFSGTFSETHSTGTTGLKIGTADLTAGYTFSFNLDEGQSTSIDLYQIYADETTVNGDDTVPQQASTVFSLSGAVADGSIDGTTVGVKDTDSLSFGPPDNHQYGQVTWNGPLTLTFSDGSVLSVSLNDAKFNEGEYYALNHGNYPYFGTAESNGAPIVATFSFEDSGAPVSGAPEPGAWALMLSGVGVLGAMLRRTRARGRREDFCAVPA